MLGGRAAIGRVARRCPRPGCSPSTTWAASSKTTIRRWPSSTTGRGVALARRLGNAETEALFAAGLAWNTFFAGRPRESLAMLEQIDVNDIGPYARGQIDTGRELLLVLLGDRDGASAVRRSIDVDYQSISHHEFRAWHIGNRANLELLDGRINQAMRLADQFLATNVDAYYGNLMVARCAFRLGDRPRARAAVHAVDAAPRKGRAVEARRLAL